MTRPTVGVRSGMTVTSRVEARFAERASEGRVALVPYMTAGFPGAGETVPIMEALDDAGADVIELGIPFSDPLADGPTIQRSSFVALEHGMSVVRVLEILGRFRARRDTPVVLMTYLNPVLRFGVEAFCRAAREAGADGLVLTDLPAGADPETEALVATAGLDLVRLVAPTTSPERAEEVASSGSGFLYYISRTGVTGARDRLPPALVDEVTALRQRVSLPVAVGFGISTPAQAAGVAEVADGVVVGSALVQRVEEGGAAAAARFLEGLRNAIDRRSSG